MIIVEPKDLRKFAAGFEEAPVLKFLRQFLFIPLATLVSSALA